jgi:hypothetical protein
MARVPKACHGWGETMAAYRFFDNDKLEWHAIWEPRWQQTQERMAEMAPGLPCTRLVYVAGREADLMALMERAQALGTPADWLVRAAHNCCLPQADTLWERTTQGEAVGQIAFMMASRHGVKARTVR